MGRVTNMNMSIVWCPANPWLQYNLQWIVITHQPGVSTVTSPPGYNSWYHGYIIKDIG